MGERRDEGLIDRDGYSEIGRNGKRLGEIWCGEEWREGRRERRMGKRGKAQ